MLQRLVVRAHGGGDLRLHGGEIVEFVDHADVEAGRAGLAVPAVGALATIGVERRVCDDRSEVLFLVRGVLVGNGLIDLFLRVIAA